MTLTATHLNYYFTCKRKLWLFAHQITCEKESELVKIGNVYHQEIKNESIEIDNFKIDKFRDGKVFELKKKNSAPEAAKFQVLFYISKLKEKGINTSGVIKYKENNKLEPVELTQENELLLTEALSKAAELCAQDQAPVAKKIKYCNKCSYYELCYA